jgi:hypothetical protein
MEPGRSTRSVVYVHHTRDRDGDVILYFTDPKAGDRRTTMQSSPVLGLRRVYEAALTGDVARYIVSTRNTDYDLHMPREKAHHLAKELHLTLS